MAKKNFTDGLDGLFNNNDFKKDEIVSTESAEPVEKKEVVARKKRSSSRKNFTSDLDVLFQESIEEAVIEKTQKLKKQTNPTKERTKSRQKLKRTFSGLDALIRQTVDSSQLKVEKTEKGKKRLTVTLDKEQLVKFKNVARLKKTYLKDIISQMVDDYIQKNA